MMGIFTGIALLLFMSNGYAEQIADKLYMVTVQENVPIGSSVARIEADSQLGFLVRYEFLSNPDETFWLTRSTKDCLIQTWKHLDREILDSYHVIVNAIGATGHSQNMNIHILVGDENDNPPIFQEDHYGVVVPDTLAVGAAMATVKAVDADQGENGTVRYQLRPNSSVFAVNEKSGILTTRIELNKNVSDFQVLTIMAEDSGTPALSAFTTLTVTVKKATRKDKDTHHLDMEDITEQLTTQKSVNKHLTEKLTHLKAKQQKDDCLFKVLQEEMVKMARHIVSNARQNRYSPSNSIDITTGITKATDVCNTNPMDCNWINWSTEDGVYTIYPLSNNKTYGFDVFCNMGSGQNKWTVIQKRKNGAVNFTRNWLSYRNGFGSFDGEFWLGNENIFHIIKNKNYILRITLVNFQNETRYAEYKDFKISDEQTRYSLTIGQYSGTAGDGLSLMHGQSFKTFDSSEESTGDDCAHRLGAGWWYRELLCDGLPNLNGLYQTDEGGLQWQHATFEGEQGIMYTEMKIREDVV